MVGLIVIGPSARTGDAEPPNPAAPASTLEPRQLFTPYAADEGALTFEQLSAHEQAVIEAEREREPAAVREARFAALKAMTIERGERTHAEAQASMIGLDGVGNEGVLP